MIPRPARLTGLLVALVGCAPAGPPVADSTDGSAVEPPAAMSATAPDSAAVATALETLRSFLDASLEGSRAGPPTGSSCAGDAGAVAGPMLAAYEMLPPTTRADTVVGRAVVTTVAEQDLDRRHPGYFVARLRVRSDTLEWDLVPSGDGAWTVCNGLSFGLTAPDSLTTWRPEGASAAAARALADSIASRR